jgi:hypothetical protein
MVCTTPLASHSNCNGKAHEFDKVVLHYLCAFHRKLGEHSSPFDKLSRSSLKKWFTLDGKFKPRVENSIERGRAFTIIEQHIPLLDRRP